MSQYHFDPATYADVMREIPGAAEVARGADFAVAAFTLSDGRMGFLAGGARDGQTFDELKLKLLAGLADQAKLAVSGVR